MLCLCQFKVLMMHLDRDEEDEQGEASANAKNKAISSLLKGPKSQNHHHNNHSAPVESDDEESEDEDQPSVRSLFFFFKASVFHRIISFSGDINNITVINYSKLKEIRLKCYSLINVLFG